MKRSNIKQLVFAQLLALTIGLVSTAAFANATKTAVKGKQIAQTLPMEDSDLLYTSALSQKQKEKLSWDLDQALLKIPDYESLPIEQQIDLKQSLVQILDQDVKMKKNKKPAKDEVVGYQALLKVQEIPSSEYSQKDPTVVEEANEFQVTYKLFSNSIQLYGRRHLKISVEAVSEIKSKSFGDALQNLNQRVSWNSVAPEPTSGSMRFVIRF
ncbi:MAG: hypothetical protein ACOYOK_03265 [Pseudobdellovibrionaceae bacterium]